MSERISTTTVYDGSQQCECGRILTPLEVMYSRGGLCETCRSESMDTLIKNRMAPGR